MTEPEASADYRWEVRDWDPESPFHSSLAIADLTDELVCLSLDPATVRDLHAALTIIRNAQVRAVTGMDAPDTQDAPDPTPSPVDSGADPTAPSPETTDQATGPSWWQRHRAFTALLLIIGLITVFGFISGASRI